MPSQPDLFLRELEEKDVADCISLFRETVHSVNIQDYSPEQVDAWAPEFIDSHAWWESLSKNIAYVAINKGKIIGFGDMSYDGYFDRLFIHKDFQRTGVASLIAKKLEARAMELHIKEITTEASITAKPFFEKGGYIVCHEQLIDFNGKKFINFLMKKRLITS